MRRPLFDMDSRPLTEITALSSPVVWNRFIYVLTTFFLSMLFLYMPDRDEKATHPSCYSLVWRHEEFGVGFGIVWWFPPPSLEPNRSELPLVSGAEKYDLEHDLVLRMLCGSSTRLLSHRKQNGWSLKNEMFAVKTQREHFFLSLVVLSVTSSSREIILCWCCAGLLSNRCNM